ncbi:hypothetical protein [Deferrisoma palaeochoriense]
MIHAFRDPAFRRTVLPVFLGLYVAAAAVFGGFLHLETLRHAQETARALAGHLRTELSRSVGLERIEARLSDPVGYQLFDNLVRTRLTGIGLVDVRLYAPDGRILYATAKELLHRPADHEEVEEAARGEPVAELITARTYRTRYGLASPGPLIEAYLPIFPDRSPSPVLEAYIDFRHGSALAWHMFWAGSAVLAVATFLALVVAARLHARVHHLEDTLERLETFLPICAKCKKIRVEEEGKPKEWVSVEQYFEERQDVAFSHGLCDDCLRELYPDVADDVLAKKKG